MLRATATPLRYAGILLLGVGASPPLLSLSVTGFPWISALLPHALALWVTMSRELRRHWVATMLCTLLVLELSFHCYELGKTVGVVFIVAAVLQRDASPIMRFAWLIAGSAQLVDAVLIHPSANFPGFGITKDVAGHPAFGISALGRGLKTLVTSLATFDLDLPILLGAGFLSLLFFKRDRWFLLVLLLVQIGAVFMLATSGPGVMRPRRFILVSCYCLVCILSMYREAGPRPRRMIIGLLLIGTSWQVANLLHFIGVPLSSQVEGFSEPYVHSGEGVGLVLFPYVDWAEEMRSRVEAGEQLLLVYNFSCYGENTTNPVGVLERLYLALGHERFVRSMYVFGSQTCRYSCLPIRRLEELGPFLEGIRSDGPTPPTGLVGYYPQDCAQMDMKADELRRIYETISQRFLLRTTMPRPNLLRFTIAGERDGGDPAEAPR
jgi:hypothetical protein